MKRHIYKLATFSLAALALLSSCDSDDDVTIEDDNTLVVPTTYNFEDVSFSGQTTRQDMLTELKDLLKSAHVTDNSVTLDAAVLNSMFVDGTGFSNTELNESGKKLGNKTAGNETGADFFYQNAIDFLADASLASIATDTAEPGKFGIRSGSRTVLVNALGFEYAQVIEKGLMSTTFMDQALNNYLTDIELDDNTDDTYEEGKGTEMAHHWDEAYGYFTDSKNFPADGIERFWGNYSNNRDAIIGTNESLGFAFRKGRAAIIAGETATVVEQAAFIKTEWTKLAAANAIHYFNTGRASYSNIENRLHQLSECYGFLLGVKVGGGDVNDIISTLETTGLYDITEAQLLEFATTIATQYGLTDVQSQL